LQTRALRRGGRGGREGVGAREELIYKIIKYTASAVLYTNQFINFAINAVSNEQYLHNIL